MSIERMESIVVLIPASLRDRFITWLYQERQVHLEEFGEVSQARPERFSSSEEDTSVAELQISRLGGAIDFLREVHKQPLDFLEGIFPVRMLASQQEVDDAVSAVDPEALFTGCGKLRDALESAREKREHIIAERARLRELDFLKVKLSSFRQLRHIAFRIVTVSGAAQKMFLSDSRLSEDILIEAASGTDTAATYVIAGPLSKMQAIDDVISEYTLRELSLPLREGTVGEELETLGRELEAAETREREIRNEAVELAKRMTYKAGIALAWWESERTRILQKAYMVGSDAVFAARGFIRANHFDGFKARLEKAFPGAELERLAIKEADDPPVSVTWNSFFRPAGLLVKMFGLPLYRSIDPTAFLTLSFFIFFGICYGDLLYGVMLILVARWLKKRFHDQRGLVEFFRLFTYAGVSTMFFGIVTGSWGADLPKYFGEGNPVDTLRLRLTLLDPLAKPLAALAIAIGIGIVNQFYGIFMRFLRDYQRGDIASSVYDGIFWLAYLGGLLSLTFGLAASAPRPLMYAAGGVSAVAALGLVLTQGRTEKSWLARLLTGLISLYGIMGTYGTTAFIGDVISYSRLMALGLTTTVVGMSFNIIAGMLKGVPYFGWALFIVMVILGHTFNFVMSILSAFVHSARLILLEWFSRFYEGGGVPFRPYGFQSSRLELLEN